MNVPHSNRHALSNDAPLGKALDLMSLLWAVDHALQSTSKRMKRAIGVTAPQRLVIRFVGRQPGISAGTLAETLHLHPSTLTGVLHRLQKRGLVERRPDPADGRKALFFLTRAGAMTDGVRTGTVESAIRRAIVRLKPAELAAARRVLAVLAGELEREE